MNILGVNVRFARPRETTPDGLRHPLSDGSAALLTDGKLNFAGIEERHTRRRYDGGFGNVVHAFSSSELASEIDRVDVVAISSCCGPRWTAQPGVAAEIQAHLPPGIWIGEGAVPPRLVTVDHHESHASLGFVLSGAHRALVAVIDGFGNLLDASAWSAREWWRGNFQRHSYYLAERLPKGFRLSRIGADAEGRNDVGLGEAYRALTHFCGWNSYQHAGSVMALAAFGDPSRFRNVPFVKFVADQIRCGLSNDHPRPGEVVASFLRRYGHDVSPLVGRTATPDDKMHCAVIRAFQDQLTEALCARLLKLATQQAPDTIVVAGGVAMNCLAMGELQRRFAGRVFVPPAPSDTGQGLGNAFWASSCVDSPCFSTDWPHLQPTQAPFWGIPSNGISIATKRAAKQVGLQVVDARRPEEQYQLAAQLIADGGVVAVSMGRSEYGPRALGRRSVLADARDPKSPSRMNAFKKREAYRPFAPAIMQEHLAEYFEWGVDSPFMSFAVKASALAKARIPACVHADGTARVQTLAPDSSSPLRPILERFHTLTGTPAVLNTSFNRKGEPIVQTPTEAVDAFIHSDLKALFLDGVTILRNNPL